MPDTRHDCPGQCGARVAQRHLACRICWARLPQDLQHALNEADAIRRRRPNDPARIAHHRRTVAAALAWYRANTTETTHA